MTNPVFLWRMEIITPASAMEIVGTLFEIHCMAVTTFETEEDSGDWRVEGFMGAEPDRIAIERDIIKACASVDVQPLSALRCELVPPRNWLAENMMAFPPVRIGRFFIHASDHEDKPPASSIPIRLDPGTAFGSGEHASTAGCLEVIEMLARERRVKHPLDMGCGSGILAIALAKTFHVPVVAADIDDEAARVTTFNARQNGVGRLVQAICAPGYRSPRVADGGPYDLIVSNILARPLINMAGDLARHLRPKQQGGGRVILSGLVERDGRRVLAAHQARGLKLRHWHVRDGWLTLSLQR
jgi:ribosomal protein L11 methyltransferase